MQDDNIKLEIKKYQFTIYKGAINILLKKIGLNPKMEMHALLQDFTIK